MPERIFNALFICTGNSARSIMAEVILDEVGHGRFKGYSAGSHPRGEVHPMTLQVLSEQGYDVSPLRSKGWDEFAGPQAPKMDFVITVCDQAAGETCPAWPGQPVTAHWGFADPVAVQGSAEQQLRAFRNTQTEIIRRIRLLCSLPIDQLDRLSLQHELTRLGRAAD